MSKVLYRYIVTRLPPCRQLEPRQPEAFRLLRVSLRIMDRYLIKVGRSDVRCPTCRGNSVQLALRQNSSVYRLVANRVGDWHVDTRKQEGENQHHKTAFGSTFR